MRIKNIKEARIISGIFCVMLMNPLSKTGLMRKTPYTYPTILRYVTLLHYDGYIEPIKVPLHAGSDKFKTYWRMTELGKKIYAEMIGVDDGGHA